MENADNGYSRIAIYCTFEKHIIRYHPGRPPPLLLLVVDCRESWTKESSSLPGERLVQGFRTLWLTWECLGFRTCLASDPKTVDVRLGTLDRRGCCRSKSAVLGERPTSASISAGLVK